MLTITQPGPGRDHILNHLGPATWREEQRHLLTFPSPGKLRHSGIFHHLQTHHFSSFNFLGRATHPQALSSVATSTRRPIFHHECQYVSHSVQRSLTICLTVGGRVSYLGKFALSGKLCRSSFKLHSIYRGLWLYFLILTSWKENGFL